MWQYTIFFVSVQPLMQLFSLHFWEKTSAQNVYRLHISWYTGVIEGSLILRTSWWNFVTKCVCERGQTISLRFWCYFVCSSIPEPLSIHPFLSRYFVRIMLSMDIFSKLGQQTLQSGSSPMKPVHSCPIPPTRYNYHIAFRKPKHLRVS